MQDWLRLRGVVPVVIGVVLYLYAVGVLPRRPPDQEAAENWRVKWGPLLKTLGPVVMLFGLLQLLGYL